MPPHATAFDVMRRFASAKLLEYLRQIERCAGLLSRDQVWQRPNERSNSIGNLLLHLRGNLSQWILEGLGGRTFGRDRPAEFAQRAALDPAPLLAALQSTVREACDVIGGLSDERFGESVVIQEYQTTVTAAVVHVVEHFAFHTGQIVWQTKAILDVDLSLYDTHGHRLDGRNDGIP